ncbi:hypothetical protein ACWDBW_33740 [Streptomyces sp. NPDC001107]
MRTVKSLAGTRSSVMRNPPIRMTNAGTLRSGWVALRSLFIS